MKLLLNLSMIIFLLQRSQSFLPKVKIQKNNVVLNSSKATAPSKGSLALIGSGPGDPELLTIKALKALKNANLVIADRLVSKEILDLIQCEIKVARKNPGCAEEAQTEIYEWIKKGLDDGRNVVRLKIGDPFIFGRGGEELLEARKWGIECEVIPGISSIFSAPLLAGIPLTHRSVANQVVLGTGYSKDYGTPDISAYHPEQTSVFLMAVGRLRQLTENLVELGYPPLTPVAIVENASLPNQRCIIGDLSNIFEISTKFKVKAPATIIVGEVVRVTHGNNQGLVQDCLNEKHCSMVLKFVGNNLQVVQ
mmetsp:Transcript_12455/g.18698  ORF Transcript_12455/g.18698 Transcript_12455/m.18698 type:complete len:308 (-) Transcript_12455:57-980(-)|eukprot:CAMPEP_0171455332 /NCGR_PEP_ID=MMETSP0945-20130129/2271_1 /TAXON_ID=109269 /ORGANISM="Vaucheria litorea, Strain CCMP2940" /LENGTH=307 /DNA_ID=CAMNT_0011980555 /DNA_START=115 /DNA_END=1038 /DNA_ORIENTATION=+